MKGFPDFIFYYLQNFTHVQTSNSHWFRLEKIRDLGVKTLDEDDLIALLEKSGSKGIKRAASEDDEGEEEEETKPKPKAKKQKGSEEDDKPKKEN